MEFVYKGFIRFRVTIGIRRGSRICTGTMELRACHQRFKG